MPEFEVEQHNHRTMWSCMCWMRRKASTQNSRCKLMVWNSHCSNHTTTRMDCSHRCTQDSLCKSQRMNRTVHTNHPNQKCTRQAHRFVMCCTIHNHILPSDCMRCSLLRP